MRSKIDAEDSCSSLQSEEVVEREEEKEEDGEGGGERRLERGPSEGGHSEDRSSGFQQVAEVKYSSSFHSAF